jgi:iron complex outermembrane receptor protein
MDPAAFPGMPHDGVPYNDNSQAFGTLEMNYKLTPQLTLTSQTSYYLVHTRLLYQLTGSGSAMGLFGGTNGYHRREEMQEFRLNSDFAGPLNFTAGAFIERGRFDNLFTAYGNTALRFPALLQKGQTIVDVKTESVFGQLRYKLTPQLELTAGARWTDERRSQVAYNMISGAAVNVIMPVPKIKAKNVAPEFTATYKPTDDMTIFAAYKKGYKSGSFNVGTNPTVNNTTHNEFGDEKVEGGEIGLKSRWLDRRLAFNLAVYDYKYTGLQVSANLPTTGTVVTTRTVNSGAAKIYGLESDVAYRPEAVENLNLRASLNYNHSRYNKLENIPCYGGQLVSLGCNQSPNAAGVFAGQSRSGLPLFRAPKWQANFGFDWEKEIGGFTLALENSNQYSSRYITDLGYLWRQKAFIKTDVSLTLKAPNDRWEIALIGKNLNNALTTGNCTNSNNQAGLIGGTQGTGTNTPGIAGTDEVGCFMDRGRELWVRVTFRPFN